mmetsp:Transcript_36397/g.117679  ORF Transcript_36397/g.117679 Transcript_36397/m.117679 type:complete len:942 (+) Transcript_36397:68-2893(+)
MAGAMSEDIEPLTGGGQAKSQRPMMLAGGGLLALGALLGAGMVYFADHSGLAKSEVLPDAVELSATEPETIGEMNNFSWDPASDDMPCGANGSYDFQHLSAVDPTAHEAIEKGLMMLQSERQGCAGGAMPDLPFEATSFEKGANHSFSVQVHHKYATDCSGETFKIHYFLPCAPSMKDDKHTSFVLEAHHGFQAKDWRLLRTSPLACDIRTGSAAGPETQSPRSPLVNDSAIFAISELSYQMQKKGCLEKKGHLQLKQIVQARTSVEAGLVFNLLMFVVKVSPGGAASEPLSTQLIVIKKCDGNQMGKCYKELLIPSEYTDVCSALQKPDAASPVQRRLLETGGLGHIPPDETESLVYRRQMLVPRRLAATRPPMMRRQITAGSVPDEYDPRSSNCFQHIAVYDQGSCGSCYANAVGQMIGIRRCLADEGMPSTGRRLLEKRDVTHLRAQARALADAGPTTTKRGCKCAKSWTISGGKCDNFCCNPDSSPGKWCFVEDKTCEGTNWGFCKEEIPQPPCTDSTMWADVSGDGCSWYAKNDAGCKKYSDYGQKSHCQKSCLTCPSAEPQDDSSNPWRNAMYKYMPSVSDLADCAKNSGGSAPGCDGGNTDMIWNSYMKDLDNRGLWVMGQSCKPYDLKCWTDTSGGVVNPVTGGQCGPYKDYEPWHKPCSCVPKSMRPTSYVCPAQVPSPSCSHPVPFAMFTVSNMGQGLTNSDAVLNMQRHIAEYGPIYVSFDVTNDFMNWDWSKKPVYTGGAGAAGGHAVMSVGWGKNAGVGYWLLRNSWGSSFAEKGYMKFKRGVNLDDIEASESTASMPVGNYKDWSAPYCDIKSSMRGSSWIGTQLVAYTMTLQVACSKPAAMHVFYSTRQENQKASSFSGKNQDGTASSAATPVEVKLDLRCNDFGLKNGEMWVKIKSTDAAGNEAQQSHWLSVPAVPGMTSVKACR